MLLCRADLLERQEQIGNGLMFCDIREQGDTLTVQRKISRCFIADG
ncbi:Hypothetical protein GbCGDNIH9_7059 [Granulibacter bethesdensis]|uniref:Uncharacterized protein n=1 Tax=Granulibacter bethesdensis TaxID=364410 RepID=A0AAC9KE81_9PROT|nr:Hypothetical protein GbCGDNIH9_7059 [Granulibacter bethesdensis]APH63078.1 Hypothetical protein GbCGDNIH8_8686 [Granulibacter bethesdensis]